VVSMGERTGSGKVSEKPHYSTELCGGTHVERTGDIGAFKILSEGAVASGVRRIEALTGEAALRYLAEQDNRVRSLAGRLKTTSVDLETRVETLVQERRKLEREVADLKRKLATGGGGAPEGEAVKEIAGVKAVLRLLEGVSGKDLRGMADQMKQQLGSGIVVLVATDEGKAAIVAGVTDDLIDRFNAVDLVKIGVAELGGKGGGGRPDMAQGGGPETGQAKQALAAVEQAIAG
ncbi:MAG: DHHA1 domain-containing protein, partial [Alphaproteobacteria bacterium]